MDLVTRDQAIAHIAGLTAPTAEQETLIDSIIKACSESLDKICKRSFGVKQYDELYDGTFESDLLLKNNPIVSVERVSYNYQTVMTIKNTLTTVQRATVKITDSQLELLSTASGTTTVTQLPWSSYTTLGSLKTAIELVSGWTATIETGFTSYPTSDLRPIQGQTSALNNTIQANSAVIKLHTQELTDFDVDEKIGILRLRCGEWCPSPLGWRIIYTAGFTDIPEPVREACAQWVSVLYWQAQRDPGLKHESVAGVLNRQPFETMPPNITKLVSPYRRFAV